MWFLTEGLLCLTVLWKVCGFLGNTLMFEKLFFFVWFGFYNEE